MFSEFKSIYAAAAAVLVSCSVLEDRTECPCYLSLDFSDASNYTCDSLYVRVTSQSGFDSAVMLQRNSYEDGLCLKIPDRKGVNVNVLDGSVPAEYRQQPGLQIPQGYQCPEAYMYSSFCVTDGENPVDSVKISKNYCGVSMNFISKDLDYYQVRIVGDICGYSVSGQPVPGTFEFAPFDTDPSHCFFRIPRQLDNSLMMGIRIKDDGAENFFALGNYIAQSGYDWTSADLEDIVVSVDYASTTISITINGWSVEEYFNIVI